MYVQQANFNISFCNRLNYFDFCKICLSMFEKYIAWIIFFLSCFSLKIFANLRKSAIGFTPGVFQGVYFEVFISFVNSFGIIIKGKCSPFNQGIIQQPIMSINKVITPMIELSDLPSYLLYIIK